MLYVYQDGDVNSLYIIEFLTDNIETSKGATLGMTFEEVVNLHGEEYIHEGIRLSYEEDGVFTDFTLDENNFVIMIEIL